MLGMSILLTPWCMCNTHDKLAGGGVGLFPSQLMGIGILSINLLNEMGQRSVSLQISDVLSLLFKLVGQGIISI